jgi:hypothetical protein
MGDNSPNLVTPTRTEVSGKKQWPDRPTWDRCYDFLNIFAEKFGKISVFDSTQS